MDALLTSLATGRHSTRQLATKQERPTLRAQLTRLADTLDQSFWIAFLFCNDRNGGPRPHAAMHTNLRTIEAYVEQHRCSHEDAWTILDPLPN